MQLIVQPGRVMTWDEFRNTTPPGSIALDGLVDAPPAFDSGGWANFDHHTGVDRLATRSSAAQVLLALRQGLGHALATRPTRVWVNDCDEDVCLAVWLLRHPDHAADLTDARLTELVMLADMQDTTAGCYPMPLDAPLNRALSWIIQPFREVRASGALYRRREPAFYTEVIDAVGDRVDAYLAGAGELADPDGRYERCGGGPGWALIREIGPDGRAHAVADGITAYVLLRQTGQADTGGWVYSIGKISPYITSFPLPHLYDALNHAEGTTPEGGRWGGSDLVGGSPRATGSRLNPRQIQDIVNDTLTTAAAGHGART